MKDKEQLVRLVEDHVSNVREAFKEGSIDDLRKNKSETFEIIEIDFPFGKRTCLQKKSNASSMVNSKTSEIVFLL